MRELIRAYERILRHRQRKHIEVLETGKVSMRPAVALPTSGRRVGGAVLQQGAGSQREGGTFEWTTDFNSNF